MGLYQCSQLCFHKACAYVRLLERTLVLNVAMASRPPPSGSVSIRPRGALGSCLRSCLSGVASVTARIKGEVITER